MSDKLKNTLLNVPEFTLGEQPDPFKLNQSFKVIQQALSQLEESIGDITIKNTSNTGLSDRPLTIGNMGRYMGPVQSFQPKAPVDEDFTFQTILATATNSWTLPVWPIDVGLAAIDVDVNTNNAVDYEGNTIFATKVAYPVEMTAIGQWRYNNLRNTVESFSPMSGGEATAIGTSHLNAEINYAGIGHYAHPGNATPNVMPPFEITTATSIVVGASTNAAYTHTVTMHDEIFTHYSPIHGTDGSHLDETALNVDAALAETLELGASPIVDVTSNVKQRLPYELDDLLNTDDEIPRPFILLLDETDNTLFETARYFYRDSTSFFFKGPALNVGHEFRVVTNGGVDIASKLEALSFTMSHHRHCGPQAISHEDIARSGYGPTPSKFPAVVTANKAYGWHRNTMPSEIPGNPHPQYLMRNGFAHGMDKPNMDGMMLGELPMGLETSKASEKHSTDMWDQDALSSWPILFGARAGIKLGTFAGGANPMQYLSMHGETPYGACKNIGFLTNTDWANSTLYLNATDVLFDIAATDFDIGTIITPVNQLRSKISIQGYSNSVQMHSTNSNIKVTGGLHLATGTAIVDSDFQMNGNLNTIQATNSKNISALVNGKLNQLTIDTSEDCIGRLDGQSNFMTIGTSQQSYAHVNGSFIINKMQYCTNVNFKTYGADYNATARDLYNCDIEIIGSNFSLFPSGLYNPGAVGSPDGLKYVRCNNFMVDADNRLVKRAITPNKMKIIDELSGNLVLTKDVFHLIGQAGSTSAAAADQSYFEVSSQANGVEIQAGPNGTSHDIGVYFDLSDDCHMHEIELSMEYQRVQLQLVYYQIDGSVVLATSTQLPDSDGSTQSTITWTLGTGIGTVGDRFDTLPGGAIDMGLLLVNQATDTSMSQQMKLFGGTYEYRIMRG